MTKRLKKKLRKRDWFRTYKICNFVRTQNLVHELGEKMKNDPVYLIEATCSMPTDIKHNKIIFHITIGTQAGNKVVKTTFVRRC